MACFKLLTPRMATLGNLPSWIIGGDFNPEESVVKEICRPHLEPGVPCISKSGVDMTGARKSDFAISRGINLKEVRSWVGWNFPPYASDAHNMVPVIGTLRNSAASDRSHVASSEASANSGVSQRCWL